MFQTLPDSVADIAKQMGETKTEIPVANLFATPEPEVEETVKTSEEKIIETEPEADAFDAETWAGTAVDALEGFNSKILVRVYESQQLKNVNPHVLESVLQKLTMVEYKQPVTFQPEEHPVIKTIGRVNDYKKKTIFDAEKRAKLEKAVARWLRSMNIQNDLPPGKALALAVVIAEAPLLLPLVEHYADEYLNKKKPGTPPTPAPVQKETPVTPTPPAPAATLKTDKKKKSTATANNEPKP